MEELFRPWKPGKKRKKTLAGDILTLKFFPDQKKRIVFLAHVDTVKVREKPVPVRIEKGRLYGNGSFDMKNGICMFYFIIKALHELKVPVKKTIQIILTPDEETGSTKSMSYLLMICKGAQAVLLPEPCCPDGGVKIERKGIALIRAELTGKAAHSGVDPDLGKDANRALVQLISQIDQFLQNHPQVSFNPGIMGGGSSTNMVSSHSYLEGEMRSYSNEALKKALQELEKMDHIRGVEVRISWCIPHPAMEFKEENIKLYHTAKTWVEKLDYYLPYGSSGGASDGSSLSAAGIPVLDGLGMKGEGAHTEEEYVELSDFPYRAALLANFCLINNFDKKRDKKVIG